MIFCSTTFLGLGFLAVVLGFSFILFSVTFLSSFFFIGISFEAPTDTEPPPLPIPIPDPTPNEVVHAVTNNIGAIK